MRYPPFQLCDTSNTTFTTMHWDKIFNQTSWCLNGLLFSNPSPNPGFSIQTVPTVISETPSRDTRDETGLAETLCSNYKTCCAPLNVRMKNKNLKNGFSSWDGHEKNGSVEFWVAACIQLWWDDYSHVSRANNSMGLAPLSALRCRVLLGPRHLLPGLLSSTNKNLKICAACDHWAPY